ncbi:hypothetical protein Hsc_3578 [Herbaspirillum seropedicae]|nr:hypothetical protein Hsc_3578 [Herbaspirillum seropedicae]
MRIGCARIIAFPFRTDVARFGKPAAFLRWPDAGLPAPTACVSAQTLVLPPADGLLRARPAMHGSADLPILDRLVQADARRRRDRAGT